MFGRTNVCYVKLIIGGCDKITLLVDVQSKLILLLVYVGTASDKITLLAHDKMFNFVVWSKYGIKTLIVELNSTQVWVRHEEISSVNRKHEFPKNCEPRKQSSIIAKTIRV